MLEAVIAGVGMTVFGKHQDRGVRSLSLEAATAALGDAGASMQDVDVVFFANAAGGLLTGQEMIRGQASLRGIGLAGKPVVNVENACASGSTAVHMACLAIESGRYDSVLVVGAEKMIHPDKAVTFRALAAGVDLEEATEDEATTMNVGSGSRFMDIYAAKARQYMEATGATALDFASVSMKSRAAAALNPNAQFRTLVTIDEVLASRSIADPLTMLMCAPNGDGAAALVITSDRRARALGAKTVRIRASSLVSAKDSSEPAGAVERAAKRACEQAGIGPSDVHVAEVHDAAAPAELFLYEAIGFCSKFEGAALLRSGATGLDGRISVNPSGGLLSRGHPIGATGCAQLVELTQQLRERSGVRQRRNAKVALAQNAGGQQGHDEAAAVVTILST